MRTFVAVVEEASFTAAANRLGIAKSVCSRRISDLETDLAAQLVLRTTRSVVATSTGQEYYQNCQDILARIDSANAKARRTAKDVSGRLRLSLPLDYTELVLEPKINSFAKAFPDVDLVLDLSDRFADLISDGFDAAVRVGNLTDSSLFARKLGQAETHLFASPEYLARNGTPKSFDDLSDFTFLRYSSLASGADLVADLDGQEVRKRMPSRFASNSGHYNKRLAIAGHGMALLPDFIVGNCVETGELVQLLPDHQFRNIDIHIIYPQKRDMPAALRALIDHLTQP